MARSLYALEKQLKILKMFCYSMDMVVSNDTTKVMIIKFKRIAYVDFMYDNKKLEEVTSYNVSESIFIKSLTATIALRNG
jgi:hypothetical protein